MERDSLSVDHKRGISHRFPEIFCHFLVSRTVCLVDLFIAVPLGTFLSLWANSVPSGSVVTPVAFSKEGGGFTSVGPQHDDQGDVVTAGPRPQGGAGISC